MNVGKLIWAAVSVAVAFGLNHQLRPRFEAAYEQAEASEAFGRLVLSLPALEVPTLAAHVVVEDRVQVGKRYRVRELSVRSQQARGIAPSFELFAALPDSLDALPGQKLDPSVLLQLELVVQAAGRLGSRQSFVQRDEAYVGRVVTGSWQFTDVREVWDSGQPELRGDARVVLQVEREGGVDLLTGRWSGRIVWE